MEAVFVPTNNIINKEAEDTVTEQTIPEAKKETRAGRRPANSASGQTTVRRTQEEQAVQSQLPSNIRAAGETLTVPAKRSPSRDKSQKVKKGTEHLNQNVLSLTNRQKRKQKPAFVLSV